MGDFLKYGWQIGAGVNGGSNTTTLNEDLAHPNAESGDLSPSENFQNWNDVNLSVFVRKRFFGFAAFGIELQAGQISGHTYDTKLSANADKVVSPFDPSGNTGDSHVFTNFNHRYFNPSLAAAFDITPALTLTGNIGKRYYSFEDGAAAYLNPSQLDLNGSPYGNGASHLVNSSSLWLELGVSVKPFTTIPALDNPVLNNFSIDASISKDNSVDSADVVTPATSGNNLLNDNMLDHTTFVPAAFDSAGYHVGVSYTHEFNKPTDSSVLKQPVWKLIANGAQVVIGKISTSKPEQVHDVEINIQTQDKQSSQIKIFVDGQIVEAKSLAEDGGKITVKDLEAGKSYKVQIKAKGYADTQEFKITIPDDLPEDDVFKWNSDPIILQPTEAPVLEGSDQNLHQQAQRLLQEITPSSVAIALQEHPELLESFNAIFVEADKAIQTGDYNDLQAQVLNFHELYMQTVINLDLDENQNHKNSSREKLDHLINSFSLFISAQERLFENTEYEIVIREFTAIQSQLLNLNHSQDFYAGIPLRYRKKSMYPALEAYFLNPNDDTATAAAQKFMEVYPRNFNNAAMAYNDGNPFWKENGNRSNYNHLNTAIRKAVNKAGDDSIQEQSVNFNFSVTTRDKSSVEITVSLSGDAYPQKQAGENVEFDFNKDLEVDKKYTLRVRADGYKTQEIPVKIDKDFDPANPYKMNAITLEPVKDVTQEPSQKVETIAYPLLIETSDNKRAFPTVIVNGNSDNKMTVVSSQNTDVNLAVPNLLRRTYRIEVSADGYQTQTFKVRVNRNSEQADFNLNTITLEKIVETPDVDDLPDGETASAEFSVYEGNSRIGIADATVILSQDGEKKHELDTDTNGNVNFKNIDPGMYDLSVELNGKTVPQGFVILKPNKTIVFDIFEPSIPSGKGLLDIDFVNSDGEVVEVSKCTISKVGSRSATSAKNTDHLKDPLTAGEYEITVEANGYVSKTITVEVFEKKTFFQSFVLEKAAVTPLITTPGTSLLLEELVTNGLREQDKAEFLSAEKNYTQTPGKYTATIMMKIIGSDFYTQDQTKQLAEAIFYYESDEGRAGEALAKSAKNLMTNPNQYKTTTGASTQNPAEAAKKDFEIIFSRYTTSAATADEVIAALNNPDLDKSTQVALAKDALNRLSNQTSFNLLRSQLTQWLIDNGQNAEQLAEENFNNAFDAYVSGPSLSSKSRVMTALQSSDLSKEKQVELAEDTIAKIQNQPAYKNLHTDLTDFLSDYVKAQKRPEGIAVEGFGEALSFYESGPSFSSTSRVMAALQNDDISDDKKMELAQQTLRKYENDSAQHQSLIDALTKWIADNSQQTTPPPKQYQYSDFEANLQSYAKTSDQKVALSFLNKTNLEAAFNSSVALTSHDYTAPQNQNWLQVFAKLWNDKTLTPTQKAEAFELIRVSLPDDKQYSEMAFGATRTAIYYRAVAHNRDAGSDEVSKAQYQQAAYDTMHAEANLSRLSPEDLQAIRTDLAENQFFSIDPFKTLVKGSKDFDIIIKSNGQNKKKDFIDVAEKQAAIQQEKDYQNSIGRTQDRYDQAMIRFFRTNSTVGNTIIDSLGYDAKTVNDFQDENGSIDASVSRLDIVLDITVDLNGSILEVTFSDQTTPKALIEKMPLPDNALALINRSLTLNAVKLPSFIDYVEDGTVPRYSQYTVSMELPEVRGIK